MSLPKGVDKLPSGVQIHGGQLRIDFRYQGKRCREPLTNISKISKSSIAYAKNKRDLVVTEIKEGKFDYAKHFPDSPKAALYSGWGGPDQNRTVDQGVTAWLALQESNKAASTYRIYRSKSKHVTRKWGVRRIKDITKTEMELWQAELQHNGLGPKSVNDIFTVVRGVWSAAFDDGVIQTNFMERVTNVEIDDNHDFANPFEKQELERIAAVKTTRQQDINMVMFACWCGMSVSELIALSWEDVDTEQWVITVQRARVGAHYKVPKEKARIRTIELVEPAKQWLKRQMAQTLMLPPVIVEVRQRNNIAVKEEAIHLVFRNGRSNLPWHAHSLGRWFTGHLRRAGVRHRGPNQCRHTFASQMLSNYVPMEWVARQLGHTDTTMVKKHYGRWIKTDTPNMAGMVSQMLGFNADTGGQENGDLVPKWSQLGRKS